MKRFGTTLILLAGLFVGSYGIFFSSATAQQRTLTRNDAVARLQQRLERGEARLEYAETSGYLASVLKHLEVPVSSQALVFSKTSLQSNQISPANPRAIYFNDNVYVGWIRGADLIELAAFDPALGAELYILEQRKSEQPRFEKGMGCSGCHISGNTRFVPGTLMRSIYAASSGSGFGEARSFITDHTSPFTERWGGWYVTGTHGTTKHLGNMFFSGDSNLDDLDALTGGNLKSLEKKVDLTGYLSPHSDIVALMVMSHQTQGQNLISWVGQETRMALKEQAELDQAAKKPAGEWAASTKFRINYAVDELLKYLLFVEEARLDAPMLGTSDFAQEFSGLGRRDKQGRSLRDFDLQRRLFRHPCSYLIYTDSFDHIPQPARELLYRKLWSVLTGQEQDKKFASLSAAERKAIWEILCDTKKNLPDYFYTWKREAE